MNESLFNPLSLKKTNEHRQWIASPSTELGDSGVARRITPSSDANHEEEEDRRFSTAYGGSTLSTPVPIEKRRIAIRTIVRLPFFFF
jgi:hypothetical protein